MDLEVVDRQMVNQPGTAISMIAFIYIYIYIYIHLKRMLLLFMMVHVLMALHV